MAAKIWRFLVALFDWRTYLRFIFQKPSLDVVFVTNMRDQKDRKTFLGKWRPPEGHFNGPRYWIKGVAGRTRALDIIADEMRGVKGHWNAKTLFIKGCQWADERQANVILATAGTKRLFENDADYLKEMFPRMTFTIGDNGTFLLLKGETLRALEQAGLKPGYCRIAVLGPYGFLGEMMTGVLMKMGHEVVGAGPNVGELQEVKKKFGIEVYRTFEEMGQVDAVVACTHSKAICLTTEKVELIRRHDRRLLVVDVAEPSNMVRREYEKCKNVVIRQDAGNGYSPKLKYVLGAVSYKMFRLSRGVTFGCFAEALSLSWAMKNGREKETGQRDWFSVNESNMAFIAGLFEEMGFTIPSPRCFAKPVNSFNLDLSRKKESMWTSKIRFAASKVASFLW